MFPTYWAKLSDHPFQSGVANRTLLQCWRKYFFIIDNFFLYFLLYPILKSPLLQYNCDYFLQVKTARNYRNNWDYISIFNNYRAKFSQSSQFTPLLTLKSNQIDQGWEIIQKMGIPRDAWFVCFNCREDGYYYGSKCRNSSNINLQLALNEIIQRGGWCIRVGSPLTKPLPGILNSSKIIDYPHTKYVSDFMDIFLISQCRFFLGNNSGITAAASLFGVPCVWSNVVPFGVIGAASKNEDLIIFKLHKNKNSDQLISFRNCLHSFLSWSLDEQDYDEFDIELLENSPEEIRDVVIEMLERLDKQYFYHDEDEELQNRFKSLLTSYNPARHSHGRVGMAYLKKYTHLLEPLQ